MKLKVRIAPGVGTRKHRRCGLQFSRDWTEVDIDDATARRLKADQMLEVEKEPLTRKANEREAAAVGGVAVGPAPPADTASAGESMAAAIAKTAVALDKALAKAPAKAPVKSAKKKT
jgi:hypothetical protein